MRGAIPQLRPPKQADSAEDADRGRHGDDARPEPPERAARRPQAAGALRAGAIRAASPAALAALVAASAATLVVPIAVRRVIDHGFSEGSRHLIDAYFGVLILVVAVLAVASALRYYLVITLGERVVADLRSGGVRAT